MNFMASKTPTPAPVAPKTRPKEDDGGSVVLERRTQKTKPPQMYQVVMLNDDYTPMEFVVVVIQEFFNKDRETATQIMLKIHLDGKGSPPGTHQSCGPRVGVVEEHEGLLAAGHLLDLLAQQPAVLHDGLVGAA